MQQLLEPSLRKRYEMLSAFQQNLLEAREKGANQKRQHSNRISGSIFYTAKSCTTFE